MSRSALTADAAVVADTGSVLSAAAVSFKVTVQGFARLVAVKRQSLKDRCRLAFLRDLVVRGLTGVSHL